MTFTLSIPRQGGTLQIPLASGEMLFILGANGTGKSSLMQTFYNSNVGKSRRIAAHRQTWFRSSSPEFTAQQRIDQERNLLQYDRNETARWMDDYSQQRTQMSIYDLVNAENVRARRIAHAADNKNTAQVDALVAKDSAIKTMNRLLRLANLDVAVSISDNDEITATRHGSVPYSIARLSDGERNAIIIAANVLTVPENTLLLIDEPERHLHRSIVSPLLTSLLRERADCCFVISTHEPMLPVDNPKSKVFLSRSCAYENNAVKYYDGDLVESTDVIDDDLKRTILGERRKILFVEGVEHSLDKLLYSLLFPNTSVVAKASCRDVENAVTGIRGTAELHWVKPFGLVDNDAAHSQTLPHT